MRAHPLTSARSRHTTAALLLIAVAATLSMGAKRCERGRHDCVRNCDGGSDPDAGSRGCDYDGVHREPGTSFPSDDGCNICNCSESGAVGCTKRACAPDAGSEAGCKLGDAEFDVGDSVVCADGCNQCKCEGGERWISTTALCAELPAIERCDDSVQASEGLSVTPLYRAGDALALSVEYGGGCFQHTFKLCYSGAFQESSPVQTPLRLVDTSGQTDMCLALVTTQLVFDLTPLREFYVETYPNGPNTVLLNLGRAQINYSF